MDSCANAIPSLSGVWISDCVDDRGNVYRLRRANDSGLDYGAGYDTGFGWGGGISGLAIVGNERAYFSGIGRYACLCPSEFAVHVGCDM